MLGASENAAFIHLHESKLDSNKYCSASHSSLSFQWATVDLDFFVLKVDCWLQENENTRKMR